MRQTTTEKILLALVVLTFGALIFREPLLETRMVVDANNDDVRLVLDSDVQDGGNTVTEWLDKDSLKWRCTLGEAYEWPFCGMQIYFSDSFMEGIDLSNYSHLNLDLNYSGSAKTFRIYFRNSNPLYTKPDEIRSTKFNMAELELREDETYSNIQLEFFRVADWWLQLYTLDIDLAQIEFSNIGLIEIQTGSNVVPGVHDFQLDKLELVGVRISLEQMYFIIIIVWMCTILFLLAFRIRFLQGEVKASEVKHAELQEIHALLDRRHRTLEEKSKLDPLTGAYNRSGIEESLTKAFHNWKLHGQPMSLLLFDVDHFKNINDTRGHAVGDNVLRELTLLVSDNIRGGDKFARWGGEEFIIVCGNTEIQQARALAEKLRAKIAESCFSGDLNVTVSFGVAQLGKNESLGSLFNRSDEALYVAKNSGRNGVRVSERIGAR